jgi:hypothetical protein
MDTESVALLRHRANELRKLIGDAQAQIKAYQTELQQCDAGINAMLETAKNLPSTGEDASRRSIMHHARIAHPEVQQLTMKELVLKALSERFANGATVSELVEFFAIRWGREDVARPSLSPQLSRLKEEGKITLMGKVWLLADRAPELLVKGGHGKTYDL